MFTNEKNRPWAYRAPDDGNGGGASDADKAAAKEAADKAAADAKAAEDAKKAGDNTTIKKMREDFKEQKKALDDATGKLQDIERGKMDEIERLKAEKKELEDAAKTNTGASERATELEETLKGLVKAKLEAMPEEKREQCEKFISAAPLQSQLDAIDAFAANIVPPKPVGGGKPPAPGEPNYKPGDPPKDDPEPVDLAQGMKNVGKINFGTYSQEDIDRAIKNPNGGMSEEAFDALLDKKLAEREAAKK